jgi:leucyl aminopeptidase (aminopeptidase T)
MDKVLEPTNDWYWIEVARATRKLVEEVFPIKPGENVVVTVDTVTDIRVARETVKAIYALGAIPTLIIHPVTPEAASEPPPPVAHALLGADAWIEFEESSYLLYSDAWKKAMEAGVRFLTLGGNVDSLVKMVGQVNYPVLDKFANKLVELCNKATNLYVKSTEGTNLRFMVDPKGSFGHIIREGSSVANFKGPGILQVPSGQCNIGHIPNSVEGTIVFDGSILPPDEIGVLREPVQLTIHEGRIIKITGGQEARILEKWLASFNHPAIYEMAHCGTFGFNPGVKHCKGDVTHDERVFGCMEFGIGPAWAESPGHTDGVVLHPSVWADEIQLEQDGKYVHPELIELCQQLGVTGY